MPILNPVETFADADATVEYSHENINLTSPWGYHKPENATRNYPLLVSGMWGEGERYYQDVAKDYPAFVIDYQKNSTNDGEALARWIRSATESGNRIYLTGFSYGVSSSYPLAKGMFEEQMYFAGIIRVAGQSQSDLGNEIAIQTAVWYHIGLSDTEKRVDVARQAMESIRNYECNKGAKESQLTDT